MRALIQRVSRACVIIEGNEVCSIADGYVILLGIGRDDSKDAARKLWAKISKMRIFPDEVGKTNRSIHDIEGSVIIVSQFTLYANCKRGNRPSFTDAGLPDIADELYRFFVGLAKDELGEQCVGTGEFGAEMQVSLTNDGPFTIWLDTDQL